MDVREKLIDLIMRRMGWEIRPGAEHIITIHADLDALVDALVAGGVTMKEMQKPLTVEEVRKKDVVYLDERHGRTSCPCFIDPASTEHDMYFFTGLSCVFTHRVKSYNKFWRCWAEKPTEEERKAAEWME